MSHSSAPYFRARRAGFTVLEMMVVLVIVGITTAMTAGRIQALMVQNRVQRAATAVQNDIEAAFAIASRDRRPIRISWNQATMQLNVTDRAGTTAFRRTTLGIAGYGLRRTDVAFSSNPIEIYPNGLAQAADTITISKFSYTKRVVMSRSGLVLVQGQP
jgi:prepilin-type N-terminal cleavage/methylation domain-containing protein